MVARHRHYLLNHGRLEELPHVVRWHNNLISHHPELVVALKTTCTEGLAAESLGKPSCALGEWGPADTFELFTQWRGRAKRAMDESHAGTGQQSRQRLLQPLLERLSGYNVWHSTLSAIEAGLCHASDALASLHQLLEEHDALHPAAGDINPARAARKVAQVVSLARAARLIAAPGDVIVEFGAGGGHLGLLLAFMMPECTVILLDRKVGLQPAPASLCSGILSLAPCTLIILRI